MGKFAGVIKILRLPTMLSFSFCSCAGTLVAAKALDFPSFLFSILCMSLFMVVNDLSDEELDRSAGKQRNPLVSGELKPVDVKAMSIAYFMGCALMIPAINVPLGILAMFLSTTYSLFLRTKSRPLLDMIWHGILLAILAAIGYLQCKPPSTPLLILFSGIFLISVACELLQEIHGYETDLNHVHTTVTILGKGRSLTVFKACLMGSLMTYLVSIAVGILPSMMLLAFPLFIFLVPPISRMKHDTGAFKTFYRRSFMIVAALITLLLFSSL